MTAFLFLCSTVFLIFNGLSFIIFGDISSAFGVEVEFTSVAIYIFYSNAYSLIILKVSFFMTKKLEGSNYTISFLCLFF